MRYEDITSIDLELTSSCQASCPQCARNIRGGLPNPLLPIRQLSLDDIKKILTVEDLQHLKSITICGNYGDAIIAKDCLAIVNYFRQANNTIQITLHTNGSALWKEWWVVLAETIGKYGDVKFGIDGLADTHSLYRVGTDFNKIIENAKAFIGAGGRAHWEFIVFEHNEHQVEECRVLAAEYGFMSFTAKKTPRFFLSSIGKHQPQQPVYSRDAQIVHFIREPKSEKYRNNVIERWRDLTPRQFDKHLESTVISCKAKQHKSVFIDFDGIVYPCCWMGAQPYLVSNLLDSNQFLETFVPADWRTWYDGRRGLRTVLNDTDLFQRYENNWKLNSIEGGLLRMCARTCGAQDPFTEMFNQ
jgi:MoaA/NifB/PqqE/SkfB family radical SAM enzyme